MVFTLDTPEPPIAKSGKKYKTVDDRCLACEVYGGDESPCISRKESRTLLKAHGRPCPRVDLLQENGLAASTAFDLLSDTTRAAAPVAALLNAGSLDDARRSLDRAMGAVKSVRVNDALDRMRDRDAKKRAAERKSEEDAARKRREVVRGLAHGRR